MESYMTFTLDEDYHSINQIRKFLDNAESLITPDSYHINGKLTFTVKVYPEKILCGECAPKEDYHDLLITMHKCPTIQKIESED